VLHIKVQAQTQGIDDQAKGWTTPRRIRYRRRLHEVAVELGTKDIPEKHML